MARSLPLALRVPNPPPVFVGRAAEIERLAELLKRAPVAVVHGPDTVGKLAFVLHVLHKKFRSRVDRTLYVRVAEGGDARADSEAVESSAARVLARVHEIAQLPPDEHAEIALDLAESASAWVVVDGADDPAWTFAQLAARYARAARWIFIGRHAPPVELLEQAIAIGPLAEAELAELAAAWHPDLDPRERALAAAAAHGSPWQLRRVLAERIARGPDALIVADGVGGVSGAGERVIELLALVREPVPVELLDTRAEVVDGLVARGLVRANDGRVELHPAARALRDGAARDGAARTASDAAARDAAARDAAARDGAARDAAARTAREDAARADLDFAARLAATHEPGLVADAVSIAIKTGRHDLVRAWLDVDGARIISAGYGARIGRVLLTSADLGSWPLRFAVDLGDGDRLRALAPIVSTSADRATWAEGLYRAGATDEALVAAREAGERLLVARILANRGDTADALEALANPATPAELASAARIAALANRADLAREYLARIGDHAHVLDRAEGAGAQPIDLLVTIASAYHELGDLDATEARLDVIDARLAGDPLARFVGRRAKLLRAAVRLDRGDLAGGGALLAELDTATSRASVHRPFIALLAAQHALASGDARRALAELATLPTELGGYLDGWRAALTARARLIEPGTLPLYGDTRPGLWPTIAHIHRARVALRTGARVEPHPVVGAEPFELQIAAHALAWELALVAGVADAARAAAEHAAALAESRGFACWAAEARAVLPDAAAIAGTISARMGGAQLEQQARGRGPGARRARWMLGYIDEADALDRKVCEALEPRGPVARLVAGPTAYAPGWGIDTRSKIAWLPDGRSIPLVDSPQLWRLLEILFDAPAGITKETLVARTWEVDYHPLRHDKRLHNAIHKLRKLVEDDPAEPRRIPTTLDGYRLGDDEPARRMG